MTFTLTSVPSDVTKLKLVIQASARIFSYRSYSSNSSIRARRTFTLSVEPLWPSWRVLCGWPFAVFLLMSVDSFNPFASANLAIHL